MMDEGIIYKDLLILLKPEFDALVGHTDRPPPYLGSYVVRRSAEGLGGDAIQHIFFTHAEIRNLDVALTVQHDIIQLQIPARGTT